MVWGEYYLDLVCSHFPSILIVKRFKGIHRFKRWNSLSLSGINQVLCHRYRSLTAGPRSNVFYWKVSRVLRYSFHVFELLV